jgi:ATP-dependent RNA helicase DeaD
VPTRELALQVTEELISFNKYSRLTITAIYGGASISEQLRRLKKGVDIVVGTPGRILDHLRRGTLDLKELQYLILDEADEMLNMGFIEDVEAILAESNDYRRILLFSATMPARIVALSKQYMKEVEVLKVPSKEMTTDLTDQIYFEVRDSDKFDALTRIIDVEAEFYGIVFCRTKVAVDELVTRLTQRGYAAEGLHGDVSQAQREKILKKFKGKQVTILVATDVAARGIDINNLTHVINYSLPQDSESYVHRIGRTGRAGNTGTAITFISSSEYRQFMMMQREIKVDIKKVPIPTAQHVVEIKKNRIKDELAEIIENENYTEYTKMAAELLQDQSPEVAMAALLRLAFKNELEESNYPEIRSIHVDRRGTARLFIAVGKFDGYDVRKLLRLLKRECGLTDSQIDDVRVLDSFSFATVPFEEAKEAIRRLNSIHKGGRPIAEIAQNGQEGQSRTSGSRRAHPKDQAKKGGREKRRAVAPAQRSRGADKQSRNDEMSDGDRFSRRAGSDRVTRGEQAERKSRTPKKKKGEDWKNDFAEFFAQQEQQGWGGKGGSDPQLSLSKTRKNKDR